jgi:ABC-type molybdate transport system substrate-binding protein
MKASLFPAITRVASVVLLLVSAAAVGAQLKVMSAVGVQEMMEGLGPKFERESGHKLTIVFATLGPALKRIEGGETADVIVLPAQGIDSLVKEGKAAGGDVRTVARSQLASRCAKARLSLTFHRPSLSDKPCWLQNLMP